MNNILLFLLIIILLALFVIFIEFTNNLINENEKR